MPDNDGPTAAGIESNEDEEEDELINPHVRVMMWLENRALYAENNFYRNSWENYKD